MIASKQRQGTLVVSFDGFSSHSFIFRVSFCHLVGLDAASPFRAHPQRVLDTSSFLDFLDFFPSFFNWNSTRELLFEWWNEQIYWIDWQCAVLYFTITCPSLNLLTIIIYFAKNSFRWNLLPFYKLRAIFQVRQSNPVWFRKCCGIRLKILLLHGNFKTIIMFKNSQSCNKLQLIQLVIVEIEWKSKLYCYVHWCFYCKSAWIREHQVMNCLRFWLKKRKR